MGNSTSSAEESQANERAFVRSLGDRYPLGDAELRKWCWVHDRLASVAPLPSAEAMGPLPPSLTLLSVLASWSTIYGDYNPYIRRSSQSQAHAQTNTTTTTNPVINRVDNARTSLEAISIVEK
eukprot:CAMPEP_0183736536 /NCGR_PEP_ID=MMETSP0737-20130205/49530_1 /TAXON_ID=385413 /ORGANISM="Thalassiosira miniscula, Strain CCMP1093" /LENGTH=122 /DNA_ID=CAMNT_0025970559 /DNA_START=32 /DNA_END=397 /DNA_ORIENTATION=+